MKYLSGAAIVFLLAAGLSGCAAVTKEQCAAGDWADLGKAHASVGKPADYLDKVVKSCGEHGITPDADAYMSGWTSGLQTYCTPLNGFTLGKQNKQTSPICPPRLAQGFNRGHQLGYEIWTANDRAAQAEADVRTIENRIAGLRVDFRELDCRSENKKDRKDCRKERQRIRRQLNDAEYDLLTARSDLNAIRAEAEFIIARTNAEASRVFGW